MKDASHRLGCIKRDGGEEAITAHPFFRDLDWEKLRKRELEPPFKPRIVSQSSQHNHTSLLSLPALLFSFIVVLCHNFSQLYWWHWYAACSWQDWNCSLVWFVTPALFAMCSAEIVRGCEQFWSWFHPRRAHTHPHRRGADPPEPRWLQRFLLHSTWAFACLTHKYVYSAYLYFRSIMNNLWTCLVRQTLKVFIGIWQCEFVHSLIPCCPNTPKHVDQILFLIPTLSWNSLEVHIFVLLFSIPFF